MSIITTLRWPWLWRSAELDLWLNTTDPVLSFGKVEEFVLFLRHPLFSLKSNLFQPAVKNLLITV